MFIEFSRINMWVSSIQYDDEDIEYSDNIDRVDRKKDAANVRHKPAPIEDKDWFAQQKLKKKKNETVYYPCDKKSDLYVLQQDFILHNRGYSLDIKTNDSR